MARRMTSGRVDVATGLSHRGWGTSPRQLAAWAVCCTALAAASPLGAQPTLPPGFEAAPISTGDLLRPTAIAFAPDGRIFITEQQGVVRVVQDGVVLPEPFIDLIDEVGNASDRGLLAIALDPNFMENHFVYLLYVVDPVFGQPDEPGEIASFSRLTRYAGTLESNGNVADPASRTVLIGVNPNEGMPVCYRSHSAGALRWAADGTLLISHGEGALFVGTDGGGETPTCFQPPLFGSQQDIGAFRAQQLNSMGGKIMRVDPATGLGLESNPYWNGNPLSLRSRVWVSGLRNPFRFCVKPGAAPESVGTLYIGDVGWGTYEEINVAHGGENFGWPCWEGFAITPEYPDMTPPQWGCSTIEEPVNPGPLKSPLISYHRFNGSLSVPQGITGRCVIGGVFHEGDSYPAPYRGAYFFADFNTGWVRAMKVDANDNLIGVLLFSSDVIGPVDFALHPLTGNVCYLSLLGGPAGVHEIRALFRPADITQDGAVGVADLLQVISAWGPCGTVMKPCATDLNGDATVGVVDLLEVISNWG